MSSSLKTQNGNLRKAKIISLQGITQLWLPLTLEKNLIQPTPVTLSLFSGFKIIGAHTDSPCLKIAPVSKAKFKSYAQSHVMTYGGGLWHTWFDRDLILAGKVVYNDGKQYTSKLWRSKKPLLKIPNLAIHLRLERNKFDPNPETELRPLLSSDEHQKLL